MYWLSFYAGNHTKTNLTSQNTSGGVVVGRVLANDNDYELNGKVNYFITSGKEKFGKRKKKLLVYIY